MTDFYKLNLLGVERELPILKAPSGILIAAFNPVGDMELIDRTGEYLSSVISQKNIEFDVILTTELKGVAIAQELARRTHKNYICLRKSKKCYILEPYETKSSSITSGTVKYYISKPDMEQIAGKNVLFVDDVFSTGSTLAHMAKFAKKAGFNLCAALFVLKEATQTENELEFTFKDVPVTCCGFLPLP